MDGLGYEIQTIISIIYLQQTTMSNKKIKNRLYIGFLLICITLIAGCGISKNTSTKREISASYLVNVGRSIGGFIEETEIDAVSGATYGRYCVGMHAEYIINNKHRIETGIDFIPHKQSISYYDSQYNFDGKIDFNYFRFSIPVTYNFSIIKNRNKNTILYLKTGLSANYINAHNISVTGNVPNYSLNKFVMSPLFGITVLPGRIKKNISLGLFFNTSLLYGTKLYKDEIYHYSNNTGLMSTVELGITFNIYPSKKQKKED